VQTPARAFSWICAQIVLTIGLVELVAEWAQKPASTSALLGLGALATNVGLCLILCGAAIQFSLLKKVKWPGALSFAALLLLSLIFLYSGLTEGSISLLSLDRWLERPGPQSHLAPILAASFVLLGIAGLLRLLPAVSAWINQALTLLPGLLSILIVSTHYYGVTGYFCSGRCGGNQIAPVVCLLLASLALLSLDHDRGISGMFWHQGSAGVAARILWPACLSGPLLLGLILVHLGLGQTDARMALEAFALALSALGSVLVWWSSSRLSSAYEGRQTARLDLEHSRTMYARLLEVEVANRTRELKDALNRERALLHSAADPICGVDVEQKVTFLNETAATLLGMPASEAVRMPITSLLRQLRSDKGLCKPEEFSSAVSMREGRVVRSPQEFFLKPDGSTYSAEICVTPIRSGNSAMGDVSGAMIIFRSTRERLELERMKDELLSVVSHEIRTPMGAVRGALGLMASGKIQASDPAYHQLMQLASDNVNRLIRLVNDLLDVERLESGKQILNRKVVSSQELVSSAVEPIQVLARLQDLQIETQVEEALLHVDGDRITQALSNLIGNALKFSKPGGRIVVRCSIQEERVEFSVQDEGRGIPADKLHAVFDRFRQADASDSRQNGGTGLGLTTARAIIEQHGGNIWVESQLGKGSTFHFTLPNVAYAT
jgi:PAS domain S-box-containing protein